MDLRKRLANLDRLSRKNQGLESDSSCVRDTAILEKSLKKMKLKYSPSEGEPVWTRDYFEEPNFSWGELPPLDGFFTRGAEVQPALEDILFLDTETTGLSGGTGTIAFLVGVGWFRGTVFHSRQFFLPDFSHEEAMLVSLSELAKKFKVVMTFNGASFDLPLLRTRALMNRLKDPCRTLVSWDLLVPGRRLWNGFFPNCRQQTLEKNLLKMRRSTMDIDGALIPQTWFDFLKTGDGEMISKVLHHNQRDLVGMVGIFSRVLDKARRLMDDNPREADWRQAWALGKIAEKAKLQKSAAKWMDLAVLAAENKEPISFSEHRFVRDAIRLLKRQAMWARVEVVISNALQRGLNEPWVHREASILYEYRLLNTDRALVHARQSQEQGRVHRLELKTAKESS